MSTRNVTPAAAGAKPPRRQRRTVLAPSQKYEVFTAILTSSATYREIAEKYNIDPTTIRTIVKKAKQGALDALANNTPKGKSVEQVELEEARREIEKLKATICQQAMELHLERGKRKLGLNAGLVPTRVDGPAKAGLLALIADAQEQGFSLRWAARLLGVDHARVIGWKAAQAGGGSLEDGKPGPIAGEALHALLDWEKDAVVELARSWGQVDLSHRKLAHRGSRLDQVYVSESTVLRVLTAAGMHLPGLPQVHERGAKTPWPDWVELTPGQIWIYDFTHFKGLPGWCAIAVVDVVSRFWLSFICSPEETWVQVQAAFLAALEADSKGWLIDQGLQAWLHTGTTPDDDDRLPVLLAVSDNGPQMTATKTAQFMAIARIAQHFGRPGTPNDQAWIESFFGHIKAENPNLNEITDPADLRRELEAIRQHYNNVRLHEAIGYVTPADEHFGRGQAIRDAREKGLKLARANRIATRRQMRQNETTKTSPDADL